jgi:outer membrane lipoprotein carrier protein
MDQMKDLLWQLCIIVPGIACPFPAGAAGGGDLLKTYLDGLQSFTAGFQQQVLNEQGELVEASNGTLFVQRPGRFLWRYEQPYAQQLVSDGAALWIYDAELEQVSIKDAGASLEDSPAAILGGDVDLDAHYVLIDSEPEAGVQWVELTPRDIESSYTSIRIGFVDGELAGMELADNLGQKTQIAFADAKRNVAVDAALFQFTPPAGVDVIDSRESR